MNAPMRTTSTMAIVSLVSGLLGLTVLPLVASLVAILTGHMARADIRREPERLDGDGMAVVGLVLGYAAVALAVALVLAFALFLGGLAVLFGYLGWS